jgi:glycosyltransferase 2 family protein
MRKGLILLLFLIFGVILFILTLSNVGFHTVREALSAFSFFQLVLVFIVLFSGIILMGALRWQNIMKILQVETPNFKKIILAKIVGFSLSYVTPAALFGGEPARFLILKSSNETNNNRLIASIILDKIIQFLASFLFFFVGIFLLLVYLKVNWLIQVLFFIFALFLISFFYFFLHKVKKVSNGKGIFITLAEKLYLKKIIKSTNLETKLEEVEKPIRSFLICGKQIIKKAIIYSAFEIIFVLVSLWLIIFFMNHLLTVSKVLVIKSMTDFSSIIPFPAALGTLEVTQAFVFKIFGIGATMGVALSLVYRGLNLVMAFFGILIFGFFHFEMYIQNIIEKIVRFFIFIFKNEKNNS